ncbi:unnamed protein product [Cylicostephanus goldi]|uniref:Uncharacterized protein n=1 Tax=Cylicostephanus goldi TaxID=71465 RepID=A0A3P7MBS7_CYLGO|nr:unnamed protein product [Cylicostephanus goldi]
MNPLVVAKNTFVLFAKIQILALLQAISQHRFEIKVLPQVNAKLTSINPVHYGRVICHSMPLAWQIDCTR